MLPLGDAVTFKQRGDAIDSRSPVTLGALEPGQPVTVDVAEDGVAACIASDAGREAMISEQVRWNRSTTVEVGKVAMVKRQHLLEASTCGRDVTRDRFQVGHVGGDARSRCPIGMKGGGGAGSDAKAQGLPALSGRSAGTVLEEVDDAARASRITDAEIDEVSVGALGDDDLVAVRATHKRAVGTGGFAIECVAARYSELREVHGGLGGLELVRSSCHQATLAWSWCACEEAWRVA